MLVGLEWYLRMNTLPYATPGYTQTHIERRYELVPNFSGKTYGSLLKINSSGIRDFERNILRNHYRIAVFGDSMTFGQGVDLKNIFPKVLEKKLNSLNDRKVQVFNFGVPSYSTQSEYIYLKDTYEKFRFDMVIIQYTAENDSTILHPNGNKINQNKTISFLKDIARNLYSYDFLARKFYSIMFRVNAVFNNKSNEKQESKEFYASAMYNDDFKGWIDTQEAFEKIKLFTEHRGIPLLFAVFANNTELSNDPNKDLWFPVVSKIKLALRSAGVQHIVLIDDYFREFSGREELLWVKPYDSHFSVLAHNLVAEGIFGYIVENDLLLK